MCSSISLVLSFLINQKSFESVQRWLLKVYHCCSQERALAKFEFQDDWYRNIHLKCEGVFKNGVWGSQFVHNFTKTLPIISNKISLESWYPWLLFNEISVKLNWLLMDIYLVKSCRLKAKLINLAWPHQQTHLTLHTLYDPSTFVQNVPSMWFHIWCLIEYKKWLNFGFRLFTITLYWKWWSIFLAWGIAQLVLDTLYFKPV